MITAAILDLDGVIVDSEPLHYGSEKEMLSKRGVDLRPGDVKEIVGRTEMEGIEYLRSRFGLKDSANQLYNEKQRIYKRMLRKSVKPRRGLFELLDVLEEEGLTLAIASSAPRENIDIVLRALHIKHRFRAVVSGDDVGRGKPFPDIFLLAAKRIGAEPKNCLVIEDAQNGVEAAKRAGMTCVAVPNQFTQDQDFSAANVVARSLEEIDVRLIRQINGRSIDHDRTSPSNE